MAKKRIIIIRVILILLTLALMALIFSLSADNASSSNEKSGYFSVSLAQKISELFNLDEDKTAEILKIAAVIVRKTAHFCEYALLGFLITCVCVSFYLNRRAASVIAFFAGSLYAVSDEVHQLFVPGRSGQLSDVILDSAGVAAGIAFLLLVLLIYRKIKERKANV